MTKPKVKPPLEDPRLKRKAAKAPWYYNIVILFAIVGCVLELTSIGLREWRETDEVKYYFNGYVQTYKPTQYGLYMISFNGGNKVGTWSRLKKFTCSNTDQAAPIILTGAVFNVGSQACDKTCLDHYRNRCNIYTRQGNLGFAVVGIILIAAATSVVAIIWFYVVGPSPLMLMICFLGGSVAVGAILAWYFYTSEDDWDSIGSQSQFPKPKLGYAFNVAVAGASLTAFAGVIGGICKLFQSRAEWLEQKQKLLQKVGADVGYPGQPGPGGGPKGQFPMPGGPARGPPGFGPPGGGFPPPGGGFPPPGGGFPPPGAGFPGVGPPGFGPPAGGIGFPGGFRAPPPPGMARPPFR